MVDYYLSVSLFAPSSRLHFVHVLNHHAFSASFDDWSHYRVAGHRKGWRRWFRYLIMGGWRILRHRETMLLSQAMKQLLRQEKLIIFIYALTLLFFLQWKMVWLLLSSTVGLGLLFTGNLLNHDHCKVESEWDHSRNFHSPVENWFFLNSGFHTAHHLKPHLHWTELPQFHRAHIKDKISPDLEQPSFFRFLWASITRKLEAAESIC